MLEAQVKALVDHLSTTPEPVLRGKEKEQVVRVLREWLKINYPNEAPTDAGLDGLAESLKHEDAGDRY